jgi:hypothetical protein
MDTRTLPKLTSKTENERLDSEKAERKTARKMTEQKNQDVTAVVKDSVYWGNAGPSLQDDQRNSTRVH